MLQAANPKDQYLLLKALNEALLSLAALPPGSTTLDPQHRQQAGTRCTCSSSQLLSCPPS